MTLRWLLFLLDSPPRSRFICFETSSEFFQHRNTQDTGMEFTHRPIVVHSDWKQTTRGDEEERDTQTEGPSFLFLYCIPFSPLTLLGLTALCRFSIHLSLSAAERHAKHLVPDAVVT